MTPINLDIIKTFRNNFSNLNSKPVVLYGCSERTQVIIENCSDFNFIGLMDKQNKGTCYGLPILDEQEVTQKAYCIIIICTTFNVNIIYNRIQDWTLKSNIPVYHLNGTLMEPKKQNTESLKMICNIDEYKKSIKSNDIILFELFNTLIMRKTLYRSDIFEIMQRELKNSDKCEDFSSFAKLRYKIEQDFIKDNYSYTLKEIYSDYCKDAELGSQWVLKLIDLEISTELKNVIPRTDVVSLLDYAKSIGKEIILSAPSYLSSEHINMILTACSIDHDLFDDTYNYLPLSLSIHENNNKKILYLGNKEFLSKHDLSYNGSEFLPVYSSSEIATALFDTKWSRYNNDFYCRYVMGVFISQLLNSPFKLNQSGKIDIDSLEEIGYIFFGPMVKCFMDKLYKQAKEKGQKIIFHARDCWILKNLADKYYNKYDVESVYFLISRRAVAIASIGNNDDIRQVCEIFKFNCKHTFERFCSIIFNISIDQSDTYKNTLIEDIDLEELFTHITDYYCEQIFLQAKQQKKYFFEYINKLNIDINESLAMINFVGGGITQNFLEKLGFYKTCEYYYFGLRPSATNMNSLISTVIPVFGVGSYYTSVNNAVIDRMHYEEVIFTSPQSQFMGFDDNCMPVFANEGINTEYDEIKNVHYGIEKYIKQTYDLSINLEDIDPQFVNIIFGYLFDDNISSISQKIYDTFRYDDIVVSDNKMNMNNDIIHEKRR